MHSTATDSRWAGSISAETPTVIAQLESQDTREDTAEQHSLVLT